MMAKINRTDPDYLDEFLLEGELDPNDFGKYFPDSTEVDKNTPTLEDLIAPQANSELVAAGKGSRNIPIRELGRDSDVTSMSKYGGGKITADDLTSGGQHSFNMGDVPKED